MSAFRRQAGSSKVEYGLQLSGLQNPETILPSDSFKFASFTTANDPIDLLEEGVPIQMKQNAKL